MVFTYLNSADVWSAFCGTYEAIYDLLGEWDDWWVANGSGVTIPPMQAEWKKYIETVLTSLINRSRATLDLYSAIAAMYVAKTPASPMALQVANANTTLTPFLSRIPNTLPNLAVYLTHWMTNRVTNRPLIRIAGTCSNLGSINP